MLVGAALLGILGALLAIPAAATIQIVVQEWWRARHPGDAVPDPLGPSALDGAPPADAPPPAAPGAPEPGPA